MSVLKRGHKGEEVEALQTELNALGVHCDIDGHFGPGTESAVKMFQKAFGLTADGVVGPKTREVIQRELANQGGSGC
jgi:peptidoglycan hydrolase-like protein with peptidoglycan-binding domain